MDKKTIRTVIQRLAVVDCAKLAHRLIPALDSDTLRTRDKAAGLGMAEVHEPNARLIQQRREQGRLVACR